MEHVWSESLYFSGFGTLFVPGLDESAHPIWGGGGGGDGVLVEWGTGLAHPAENREEINEGIAIGGAGLQQSFGAGTSRI